MVDDLTPQPPPFKIIIFSECFCDPVTVSPKGTELVDDLTPQPPPFKIIIFSECFGDPVTVSPKGVLKRLISLLYSFLI